jgi:signal transduction histidine kinase
MRPSVGSLARKFEGRLAEQSARGAQILSSIGEANIGIAHDLRNILALIDSCLGLAEQNISDPDKIRAFIGGARERVDRGLRLTSELLTVDTTLAPDGGNCERALTDFVRAGIDIGALAIKLQNDGAKSFVKSWKDLMGRIESKSAAIRKAS